MKNILTFFVALLIIPAVYCQKKGMSAGEYAVKYAPMAIKKMQQYGIPASITLSQGILESGCGGSRLAIEGNNHFGIKCKSDWTGDKIYEDDDELQECFRKYSSVEESYNDHSLFLTTRSRYASLFKLASDDYKGWAYGLKAAGYATNPAYAERLIKIIEDNQLFRYDKAHKIETEPQEEQVVASTPGPTIIATDDAVKTGEINGAKFIIARTGDSFTSISFKSGVPIKKLLKFNDLTREVPIADGTVIYISKKGDAAATESSYTVESPITLYEISQLFGIRLRTLEKINGKRYGKEVLPVGSEIRLR